MKNLVFWNFLIFVLITVCLFGCDQARNVTDDIIRDSPDLDSPRALDTSEEVPVVTDGKPSDPVNQTPGTEESSNDIAELLATIEDLSTEIEEIKAGPADDDGGEITTNTDPADDEDDMDEPEGLNIGDEVVAQNTVGGGLNGLLVRENAGVENTRIGGVFDGATGTITDGPEYEDNYTWWKVRWDSSDSVVCDKNPCEGWSVEFFRGSRLLTER